MYPYLRIYSVEYSLACLSCRGITLRKVRDDTDARIEPLGNTPGLLIHQEHAAGREPVIPGTFGKEYCMKHVWQWMWAALALGTVMALVGCGGGSSPSNPSTGGSPQERIVYSVYGAGLYICKSDGTNPTLLTHVDSGYEDEPVWNADGSKVAFVSEENGNMDIYVIKADGTGKTRLTTSTGQDRAPSWSPDGTKIAFYSDRGGANAIYTMNADGSSQTSIGEGYAPAWSPNGSTIAFTSARNGLDAIYTMGVDGSNATALVYTNGGCSYPVWNPQGTRIAFRAVISGPQQAQQVQHDIYILNADGSGGFTHLTHYSIGVGLGNAKRPAWSPDGTNIVFYNDAQSGNGMMVINTEDRIAQVLRTDGNNPSWTRLP